MNVPPLSFPQLTNLALGGDRHVLARIYVAAYAHINDRLNTAHALPEIHRDYTRVYPMVCMLYEYVSHIVKQTEAAFAQIKHNLRDPSSENATSRTLYIAPAELSAMLHLGLGMISPFVATCREIKLVQRCFSMRGPCPADQRAAAHILETLVRLELMPFVADLNMHWSVTNDVFVFHVRCWLLLIEVQHLRVGELLGVSFIPECLEQAIAKREAATAEPLPQRPPRSAAHVFS